MRYRYSWYRYYSWYRPILRYRYSSDTAHKVPEYPVSIADLEDHAQYRNCHGLNLKKSEMCGSCAMFWESNAI